MGKLLGDALHSAFKGMEGVVSIRTLGLAGAVELTPLPGLPGKRAYDIFLDCYHQGLLFRPAGDNLVLCPPYIVSEAEITRMVEMLAKSVKKHLAV
jgi:beta-alanine--pyruvate transaminase